MGLIVSARDINCISYNLLKRSGLIAKFKTAMYISTYGNNMEHFHKMYNTKSGVGIDLSPQSFIEVGIFTETEREVVYLTEVHRNKFIRCISKLTGVLESYYSDDLDIMSTDSSGTHINTKYKQLLSTKMNISKRDIEIKAVIREENNDVGVMISINRVPVIVSAFDFISLVYSIKDVNYINLSMHLINYIGCQYIEGFKTHHISTLNPNAENDLNKQHYASSNRLSW